MAGWLEARKMNYYGTLAGAAAYLAATAGASAWAAGSDGDREAALVRAASALDGRYGTRFTGTKATWAQRLAWPRVAAYDVCAQQSIPDGATPPAVEEAAYALAVMELTTPGILTPIVSFGRLTKSEAVVGAASRSFFSPQELGLTEDAAQLFRPTLLVVGDLIGCYLKDTTRLWAATVV